MESQLSINKIGIIKIGADIVGMDDLVGDNLFKAIAVTELQLEHTDHTIWLVGNQTHLIRNDGRRMVADWPDTGPIEDWARMKPAPLLKLADFLDTLDPKKFDISYYATDQFGEMLEPPQHECATVCCAAGHGPNAGFPIEPDDRDWNTYVLRVFGLEALGRAWGWCFSDRWECVDNTPAGAAKRIRYFVEHGSPPNAPLQMNGMAEYIFA